VQKIKNVLGVNTRKIQIPAHWGSAPHYLVPGVARLHGRNELIRKKNFIFLD